MTKKNLIIVIFALLVAIGTTIVWLKQEKKQITDEIGTWEANLQTSLFRPKTIVETEYGSSSGIRLTWEKPSQTYNHFLITITNPETVWSRKESGEHDRVSLDVTDLEPDTTYTFFVQACFDPKCGSWITSTEKPSTRTDKQILRFVDSVDESKSKLQEEMKDRIDLERVIIFTTDNTPWTENKTEWKAEEIYLQKKPFGYFVKLINQNDGEKILWAEFLNP